MGWTSVRHVSGTSHIVMLAHNSSYRKGARWTASDNSADYHIEALSKGREAVYGVLARTEKASGKTVRIGLIILTEVRNGEFYWKEMTEGCGPVVASMPLRMLKKLSHPSEFATSPESEKTCLEWRKRVEDYHSFKKTLGTLCQGDVLEFTKGVLFRIKGTELRVKKFVISEWGRRKRLIAYPDTRDPFNCRLSTRLYQQAEFSLIRQGRIERVFNSQP